MNAGLISVSGQTTVRVYNESSLPIESLMVTGPGVRTELGPIASERRVHRHLHFRGDGTLDFTARQQEVQFSGQLEGYVTGSLGGERIITVRQRGIFELSPPDLTLKVQRNIGLLGDVRTLWVF